MLSLLASDVGSDGGRIVEFVVDEKGPRFTPAALAQLLKPHCCNAGMYGICDTCIIVPL